MSATLLVLMVLIGSDDIAAAAVYSYRILLEYEYFFLFCLQVSERRLSRSYT